MPAARENSATVGYRRPGRIIGAIASIGVGVLMGIAMVQKLGFMATCDALAASSFYVSISIPIAAAAALGVVLLLERKQAGEIKSKFVGAELSGPGSPILLWGVTCCHHRNSEAVHLSG